MPHPQVRWPAPMPRAWPMCCLLQEGFPDPQRHPSLVPRTAVWNTALDWLPEVMGGPLRIGTICPTVILLPVSCPQSHKCLMTLEQKACIPSHPSLEVLGSKRRAHPLQASVSPSVHWDDNTYPNYEVTPAQMARPHGTCFLWLQVLN